MAEVTVIKRDLQGREMVRYTGQILQQDPDRILLEATFSRQDTPVDGLVLRRGDRFVETFYTNRWYNIFEIHDRQDDHLKGWYCNVGYPAEIKEKSVSYIDLALDLLVYPDKRQVVLDEDEFEELHLSGQLRSRARQALAELQALFE